MSNPSIRKNSRSRRARGTRLFDNHGTPLPLTREDQLAKIEGALQRRRARVLAATCPDIDDGMVDINTSLYITRTLLQKWRDKLADLTWDLPQSRHLRQDLPVLRSTTSEDLLGFIRAGTGRFSTPEIQTVAYTLAGEALAYDDMFDGDIGSSLRLNDKVGTVCHGIIKAARTPFDADSIWFAFQATVAGSFPQPDHTIIRNGLAHADSRIVIAAAGLVGRLHLRYGDTEACGPKGLFTWKKPLEEAASRGLAEDVMDGLLEGLGGLTPRCIVNNRQPVETCQKILDLTANIRPAAPHATAQLMKRIAIVGQAEISGSAAAHRDLCQSWRKLGVPELK